MEVRLSQLLRAVIDDYVVTAEPVSSQALVERGRLDVSSATVRNWFAELEEEGCVMQPHTSGGRIPTEKGYRLYIELFVTPKPARKHEREAMEKAVTTTEEDGRRVKHIAKTLAELSGQAALVGLNQADTFYTGLSQLFAQPEFKNWERVVGLSELLDHLDETLNAVRRDRFETPRILLGKDCPFGASCGAVLASYEDGLVGILGPVRVDYQHAFSLMHSALDLLRTIDH